MGNIRRFSVTAACLFSFVGSQVSADHHAAMKPSVPPLDVVALSLPDIVHGLESHRFSSLDLTRAYLNRIGALNRSGPTLNAVISVNASAMELAKKSDLRRAQGTANSPLDGVPVLLKDNIESKDALATTAGSTALIDNMTGRDSPLVASLRDSGAIVLGKANLSQWANFRSSHSVSGWSAVGGLVKNPHVLDRQACGSSSGSAAAAAASLAAGAIGTETNGSIICPSQVNGVVGLKPTHGLLAVDYIVPIAATQDTAGPITKSVAGAALMLDGMTGWENDYFSGLDASVVNGMRIGILDYSRNDNPRLNARFDKAIARLQAVGAEIVHIETAPDIPPAFYSASRKVLEIEFKALLDEYLAESPADIPIRNLAELVAFNTDNAEIEHAIFGQDIFESALGQPALSSVEYQDALTLIRDTTRVRGIDALLDAHNVQVLMAPSGPVSPRADVVNGDVWPAWAGAGSMAAISGYPNITVPMGTIAGVPVGASFMGSAGADALLLSVALAFEKTGGGSPVPTYKPTVNASDMSVL
ncbi:amidase family protein [Luminiphilus sp.]|nr:amidase family protein [Luminiphilus sp.]